MTEQSTDDTEQSDPFAGQRVMDVTVTSNAADGATIDVNGTAELKIFQHNKHAPVLAEIYVGDENQPLGAINTAKNETVVLGGVEEALADRVDEIREMPVEDIPDALEELAYRMNPTGREPPNADGKYDTDTKQYSTDTADEDGGSE
jgi:hypothetical protein